MANKITVWTLNMAAQLFDTHKPAIKRALKKKGYKAIFGDRRSYNQNPECDEQGFSHNLLPDIEYFVPLFPKCLGNLIEDSPEPIINDIKEYYSNCGQDDFKVFWTKKYEHWISNSR